MVRAHRCILRKGLKEFTPDLLHRLVDKIVDKADSSANIPYKFAANAII
jgi:hypothetical protein